jgi:hypothetical protein
VPLASLCPDHLIAVNFVLLALLGLDTWIEAETKDDPISVQVLQIASCVELALVVGFSVRHICECGLRLARCARSDTVVADLVARHNREGGVPEIPSLFASSQGAVLNPSRDAYAKYASASAAAAGSDLTTETSPEELLASLRGGEVRGADVERIQIIIDAFVQRDTELMRENERLNRLVQDRHLESAASSGSQSARDQSMELKRLREQCHQDMVRYTSLQDEATQLRAERDRALADIKQLHAIIHDERRKSIKAQMTLAIERQSNQRAQQAIDALGDISATDASEMVDLSLSALLQAKPASMAGPGIAARPSGSSPGMIRTRSSGDHTSINGASPVDPSGLLMEASESTPPEIVGALSSMRPPPKGGRPTSTS